MTLLRYLLALALTLLPWTDAFGASGITQITVKDAGGTTRNVNVTSDTGAITGNLMFNNVLCDPTTTTQCAAVSAGGALTVINAGTFAVQATLQATATTAIGKVDPNTISTWGLVAQGGGSAPTNATVVGGTFNTAPPTLTNGQSGAISLTARAAAFTNIDAMGGTSIASGCTAALNGFSSTIPSTVCGVFGSYVLNSVSPITPADGASNPTTTSPVIGFNEGWNGSTWDRIKSLKGYLAVVNGGNFYQAVAASQTAAVLQSSTGATGDYLSHCVIYPASTSPGVVTVFDNTNTAANSAILFAGGASSVSNLAPISVPVGAVSVNGAWKVTTGSSVSTVCYGKFS